MFEDSHLDRCIVSLQIGAPRLGQCQPWFQSIAMATFHWTLVFHFGNTGATILDTARGGGMAGRDCVAVLGRI